MSEAFLEAEPGRGLAKPPEGEARRRREAELPEGRWGVGERQHSGLLNAQRTGLLYAPRSEGGLGERKGARSN